MEKIAIIGVGCRFPSADNPADFWELLSNKVDAIRELSSRPFDWGLLNEDSLVPTIGKSKNVWGGFLENIEYFEPNFFQISPKEAERMDPQQRLLLEVAWESLEDAGIVPSKELSATQTGVFLGASNYDYGLVLAKTKPPINAYNGIGTSLAIIANRLSYLLNLRGPSLVIDAACASSLVAIHYACESLLSGESNLCLAGGVSLILSPEATLSLFHAQMMAADGRCKTFDAAADGYVRGEGCGVVVLKRLSDALRDGDNIQGIIRGSAINQDGLSNGLTAPNGPAQQAVIRKALANAEVKPSQISYVETHGTGTPLGDSIEVNALKTVLMEDREANQPCWIGSVKTNIGHLEAASGIASLIKVVLSLKHGEIPANLNFKELNPYIKIKNTPIQIPIETQEWPAQEEARLAGVNAFGFGGTNAYLILEEAPPQVKSQNLRDRSCHLLTLSAKTELSLQGLVSRYQNHLDTEPDQEIANICYTANTGREHFQHRLAVVAESKEQLREKLATFATDQENTALFSNQVSKKRPKIAFLFTGEGSQYINMGRQLYENQPIFRQTIEQCNEILSPYLEHSLLDILYPDQAGEEIPSLLDQTAYSQPALFAFEYALYQLWQSWGIKPKAVMGYDVGEYVAATVAGVFSLEDGLKLIAHRGQLMRQLPSGGDMVSVANEVTYNKPQIKLVSSVTGNLADEEIIKAQYWVNHLSQEVQSAISMETLHQLGHKVFLEIGAKPILLDMQPQYQEDDSKGLWLPSLRPGMDEWQVMLSSLGQLYVGGANVDWSGFERDYERQKVPLPTYVFQRERYWVETDNISPRKQYLPKNSNIHPLLGQKIRLAGSQEHRFESELSIAELAYLNHHRVFDKPVLPATAYLEMALAAGANVFKSDNLILENVNIYQALIFSEDRDKTVQIVLKALGHDNYKFEIFSFSTEENLENQAFTLHASGNVLKGKEKPEIEAVNLSDLQREYTDKVPMESLYRELENQGMIYGESFQAVKSLGKNQDKVLGLIELSPELDQEAAKYQIHPALLDSCLHSVYALNLDQDRVDSLALYLPIKINRLKLYRSSSSKLWTQAGISYKDPKHQEISNSDALLFDDNGVVVAEVEGLIGKRVSREAFLNVLQKLELEQQATISTENTQIWQQIKTADKSDRLELLTAYLQEQVGRILGYKGSQLPNLEQNFFEMGMDSLMVMELRNKIQTDLRVDIHIPTLMEEANILAISSKLGHQLASINITQTVEPENNNQFHLPNVKDSNWIEIEI
ncbi:MAG: acyltransferase domain-containing protein [Moorea sp. SIO2B7]|nr:acyltransferase domain-containing protein [Moorena sp. SIO2B7]